MKNKWKLNTAGLKIIDLKTRLLRVYQSLSNHGLVVTSQLREVVEIQMELLKLRQKDGKRGNC